MTLYYLLRWLSLIAIGLLIYGQTFLFGFTFDDRAFIVTNLYIKDFSRIPLIWHFFPMTRLVGMYSFAFNYYFGQLHTLGYHIFNFIVHLCATGLVWALASLIFKTTQYLPAENRLTKQLPFMIALLFLVHPGQTQAVTYISQRFESMAAVFYLGTVYCYLYARLSTDRINKIRGFCFAGFLAMLGLMTKETIITVPVMILAVEWILFPKKNHQWPLIIFAVTCAALYELFINMGQAGISGLFRSIPSESHDGEMLTPMRYGLTQMRVFLTFLRLLVLPIHQNLDYDYPASSGLLHPPLTFVGLGVISGLIVLIVKLRRRNKLIAFGLAWMLITFLVNLAPRANVIFEHKLYLISFGFLLAFVGALSKIGLSRGTLLRLLWCVVAVLALATFQRNRIWGDELTLWNDTVQKSPHKARPYNNRGLAFYAKGNNTQAIADYNMAIELSPKYADAYDNRGIVSYAQGKFIQAIADFDKTLELNPNYVNAYNNRGVAYVRLNKCTQAIADYSRAIQLNPYWAEVYNNRGGAYFHQGRLTEAIADYSKAIEQNSGYMEAYNNRGNAYAQQGRSAQALADYNKAIALAPDFAQTYNNRAVVWYQFKEYVKAQNDLRRAKELGWAVSPQFLKALNKVSGTNG
jgi:tetratricopeptide (TPR) repeat protein